MNFDPDPLHDAALAGAESVCRDVLPGLPTDADGFFREAHRALEAKGLFSGASIEAAARIAMRIGAASGSLASVFASGFGFVRARRLAGSIGVLALDGLLAVAQDAHASRLNGDIKSVAGGRVATHAIVAANTDGGEAAVVCVDLGVSGVSRIPASGTLGFDRLPICALRFDGVDVDEKSLIASGIPAIASIRLLRSIDRTLDAAIAIGIGRRAFGIAVERLRSRGTRPSQSTEFSLSDVATDLDAAELSVLHAAWTLDRDTPLSLDAASAKLLATRAATRAAHTALVLVGSTDYTEDLRQCYLEACALEFHHETSAEQVAIIASEVLEES